MTKLARSVIEGLKDQPFVLALVVINVVFIGATSFTLHKIAERGEARDRLISELAKGCSPDR